MTAAVLAIDGALGPFSAALLFTDGTTPPRSAAGRGNDALEAGLGLVHGVLGDRALADVARIVVTTGPGSFTGLRIAASYAKSLAFAAGLPLVGIGCFEVLEPETPGASLVVIPSRAGHANLRLRLADGRRARFGGPVETIVPLVVARLAAGAPLLIASGPGAAVAGVLRRLGELGVHVTTASISAPIALAVAARSLHLQPLASPHALAVQYGEGPGSESPPPA